MWAWWNKQPGWRILHDKKQEKTKVLSYAATRKWIRLTTDGFRTGFFPNWDSRWESSLANTLSAVLWDPEQRTHLNHAWSPDPQKFQDSRCDWLSHYFPSNLFYNNIKLIHYSRHFFLPLKYLSSYLSLTLGCELPIGLLIIPLYLEDEYKMFGTHLFWICVVTPKHTQTHELFLVAKYYSVYANCMNE